MRTEEQFFWRSEIVQQEQLRGISATRHNGRMITGTADEKPNEELEELLGVGVCLGESLRMGEC
jgi:hypothetical protein